VGVAIRDMPILCPDRVCFAGDPIAAVAAKAVGELTNVTVPAALANAVARACGARIMELPVTAERVLAALQAKSRAAGLAAD
jgi:CO/xanthine dehydrogenase Mo-binding subunit